MLICGNCLMVDKEDKEIAYKTARELKDRGLAYYFRCKLWGGGTTPEKYYRGIGNDGLEALKEIDRRVMPTGTEVQIPEHICDCQGKLSFIWIGARNCQNYGLLESLRGFFGEVLIKRSFGMTIDELIGLSDIYKARIGKSIYIIERGINTFDRLPDSRWSPDLKGVIRIKNKRPDIFSRLVVDCSHSVGRKEYIEDTYKAFKAIGVNHFMFECSSQPEKSKTDKGQMLSIDELEKILK